MSVKIKNRQYENLFKLPSETINPDWLIGNTGDWIDAVFDMEVGIDFVATSAEPLMINFEERTIKIMNGRKWGDYGFDINRTIKMTYTRTITPVDGDPVVETELFDVVIENLYNDTLVYEDNANILLIGFEIIPTDRGTEKIHAVKLYDERATEGVRMKYGHINNADVTSHNPQSFIDGTTTEMIYAGLNLITDDSFKDMEFINLQSGMSIESAKIRKVSAGGDENVEYSIADTGDIYLTLPNNWQSVGQSVAMTTPSPVAPYQNTIRMNFGSSADSDQMFLYNADFSGQRNLDIRIGTIIKNNYGGGDYKTLKLLLHKFNGGTAMNHVSYVVLDTYVVTNGIRGYQLTYDDVITMTILEGESYAIGYAWEISNPSPFLSPSVQYQTNFGSVEVLDIVNDSSYKTNYQVKLKFMLSSVFEDTQQMIDRVIPQNLFDANSLTDIIDVSFFPEWNNPNTVIKNDLTLSERLGNTGWFNENYNGLTNDFVVKGLRYEDVAGSPVSTISFGSDTKVKVTIGNVLNLVPDQTKISYGFMWIPKDEEDFKEKTTPFFKNTKVSSPNTQTFALGTTTATVFDGYSIDNAKMNSKNIIVTQFGDDLKIEFTLSPTPDFLQFFQNKDDDDRLFALWVSVCDSTLVTNFSDRVNILLDVQQMDVNIPVQGFLEGVVNKFVEHPQANDVTGVDLYDGFIEDDILSRSNFQLKRTEKLNAITFGFEVENITSGDTYVLERFSANTTAFPDLNGVREIDLNQTRGFLLPFDNNKNWVKVVRDPGADTDEKIGYISYFGSKIRWEDWLQRQGVPGEFYDPTKPNNGFNNNWLDYLRNGTNHRINFFILFDIDRSGTPARLKNSFNLTFSGYDENEIIDVEHNYRDPDTNTLLNIGTDEETGDPLGVILSNKKTKIEIIYTKTDGDFDIGNVYCSTSMEVYQGGGEMQHHQISSIWTHDQGGLLIPLEDETRLKVEQIATNKIRATCLVDNEQLEQVQKYKITGRIGCFLNTNGIPINTRIYDASQYESNYQ
jgi:hypothetical protein